VLISNLTGVHEWVKIEDERKRQRSFLRDRRSCQTDVGCIRSLYRSRITQLRKEAGLEVLEIPTQTQSPTNVSEALELIILSLKCPSEPVQEGSALFYKYEHEYFGDTGTLRIRERYIRLKA
jgi:hypothetical protein